LLFPRSSGAGRSRDGRPSFGDRRCGLGQRRIGDTDHLAPALAPDLEHRGALEDVGVLEAEVSVGRELRHQLRTHVLSKIAAGVLRRLQRGIEPLVAVVPDQRLGGHDRRSVLSERLGVCPHGPPQPG
jgi:hypothetical protein